MPINLGSGAISAAKIGSTDVAKIMLGSTEVFSSGLSDPSTVSGMIQWLDASDSSTITFSSSPYVGQITDKTPGSSAYWSPVVNEEPYVTTSAQNGLQVLDFSQSRQSTLWISSTPVPIYPASTLFFVASPSTVSNSYLLSGNYGAGGQPAILSQYNITAQPSAQDFEWYSTAAANFATWGSSGSSSVHLLTASIDGSGNTVLFFDGSQVASVSSSSSFTSSNGFMRLGSAGSAGFSQFRFCELIMYDSVLSSADRAAVEGYLQTKWGL